MFNGDASKKLLLVSFDKSSLDLCEESLMLICQVDLVTCMEQLEANSYSHSAVVYVMGAASHTHFHNIQFIRNKFEKHPVYVLSSSVSIPLLLQTTRLHINDVFLLPFSKKDIQLFTDALNNDTQVNCFERLGSVPNDRVEDSIINETPMGSILGNIEKNFHQGPTLNALSDNFHLSPSRLCHMFKDVCGITFSQYLLCRKLEESERLLSDANESLTTIAYNLGFSNPSHFSRSFKEHFNITPSSYLNGNRNVEQSTLFKRYLRLRVHVLPSAQNKALQAHNKKVANGNT